MSQLMPTPIILAIVATIVITGLLTAMLHRMNAPKGMQRRESDDGGTAFVPLIVAGDAGRDRSDADGDGSADG